MNLPPAHRSASPIRTTILASGDISAAAMTEVLDPHCGTALVVGFVSPHCDFPDVARRVRTGLPADTAMVLVTTAGELCGDQVGNPYCATDTGWDRVVLQGFSRRLVTQVAIERVALPNADIRSGGPLLRHDERLARMGESLAQVRLPFKCDYRDTFVLTFVDGLSHSENYLMEAIYRSGRFPLLFAGGSAGGTLDFQHTYIFDGEQVLEDHALLCFIKLAPGMRYGVFKTQNFKRTNKSLIIADADAPRRIVRTVIDPTTLKTIPFLDALAGALDCSRDALDGRFANMTFGVDVDGEIYVRSVASLSHGDGSASFYCDVDFGDCLHLLEPTDFVATTRDDFRRFLAGKPPPLGGLFNDCILRRLNNADRLGAMDVFRGIPLAGFSTFGELLGININQTLTAIFFFEADGEFADDLIDRFPIHYAAFRAYFDTRATNRLRTLHGLRQEQEKIRRALRREHDFSQAVIESLPGVFALLDEAGALVLWNRNLEALTGVSAADLAKTPIGDLFLADDQPLVAERIGRAFAGSRADAEARLLANDGQPVAHYFTGLPVTLDGERYVAGIGLDITERKRVEVALHASRNRLKRITDSLFEGVLVIDSSGQVVFANPAAKRLSGCDADVGDIEGHPLDTILRLMRRDREVTFADGPWREVLATGQTMRDDDAVFITADSQSLSVAYACSQLTEGDGRRAIILSFRDVGALRQAQREALQASRLATVGQLAAGIAHEINTPIQYIGDNLRFVSTTAAKLNTVIDAARKTGDPTVEAAAAAVRLPYLLNELPVAIKEALDGVAQIGTIVLSMKEFSHPGTTNKTMIDLNRAIESTLTVSHNAWKDVAVLEKNLDPGLPPVLCLASEINQVLLNLIINAAHAIEASGKPRPGTLSISTARVGAEVEIRVADSGTGIPDAIRNRIFDPFFTTKEVGKGTGQGLAICRDVVVIKHGGRIEVGGRPGIGAVFTIRLPIGANAAHRDSVET